MFLFPLQYFPHKNLKICVWASVVRMVCQSSLSESQALWGLLSSPCGFLELKKHWNDSGLQRERSIIWSTGYLERSRFYLHCWHSGKDGWLLGCGSSSFFSYFFFFLADRIRMLLKVFPQHFYIYEYLILLLQAKKKRKKDELGWLLQEKKKAWALNNEMPLSLCCTAGDLAWKSPCVEEQQSRSNSQCWRQPHPRFALRSLKWQLLGLVLTFNQYFMDCHVLMKLEIFAFCIWLLHMWFISSQEKLWNCVLILKGSLAFYSFRGLITLNRRVQSSIIHEEIKEAQHYY